MNSIWIFSSAILSFIVSCTLGKIIIPFLHKLKYGQTILEIGPKWHKNKQGTPTMGGIMFIISSVVTSILIIPLYYKSKATEMYISDYSISIARVIAGLLMALGFGLVGFFDDYIKVVKKRNLGLTAREKLLLQFLIAAAYLSTIYLSGGSTSTLIPFFGSYNIGILYYPIAAILIVGTVNAVNLTDGIDGLNASVTFFISVFFMIISTYTGNMPISILSASLAGGCLGYLVWNFYPAKVFMGDTGSLFLGGFLSALAFGINIPILLIPLGIVYWLEMFSVVLQVLYFKLTKGKRLFKMSPIHHHFELNGWNEIKICLVFSFMAICSGLLTLTLVVLGV